MGDSLQRIAALARIIIIDGIRRHALIGLLVLSLSAEACGLLFFDFVSRDIGRAASDFIFSISWLAGFIFIFFHAVQVIAWDDDRRVIHALLARPLSRGEYVLGVFVGLSILLLLLNLILCAIGWGTLILIRHMVTTAYFELFSVTYYALTWFGLFAMELMILAVIVLFSGLIRGGLPVLLISLSFYAICSGLPVVRETFNQRAEEKGQIIMAGLFKTMTAIFPDFSRFDFKNAILTADPLPAVTTLLTNFGVVLCYVVVVLWMACAVYQRRDLQ